MCGVRIPSVAVGWFVNQLEYSMSLAPITIDRIRTAWASGIAPSVCASRLRVALITVISMYVRMDEQVLALP